MKRLIHEIHRRSLWQVLGIYVLGAWVALQVVDVLANNFGLPEWFPAFALALLVIGLPIVLATAFVQEGVGPKDVSSADAAIEAEAKPVEAGTHRGLFTWRNAIGGGVAASLLWGGVALGWFLFGRGDVIRSPVPAVASVADLRSVAVLPFATRARQGDEDALIFSEGMHDDVLTQLSKIDSLKVISRTTMVRYAGSELSVPEIAAELGVATVLEGGVDRAGDRVRVNVQLIEAATDRHLWAETYDEQLTAANVFAIRTDLARKIAGALRAALTPEVEARIAERPTESLEAYDLYLRGRYVYEGPRSGTKEGLEEARDLFARAIAADSGFALAWVGLADAYDYGSSLGVFPEDEVREPAWEAVDRALELDPDLAEAHSRRALQWWFNERRPEEAERAILWALELNPGSATVHRRYAGLLTEMERYDEALPVRRRSVELDPLSVNNRRALGSLLITLGEYEAAVAEFQRLIEMEPGYALTYYYLGLALAKQGEYEAAIEVEEQARELDPENHFVPALLAWVHARAGHTDEASGLLAGIPEEGELLKEIAIVRGELGERDEAFAYLERALEESANWITGLETDPTADSLRADPRFEELLRRAGGR